MGVRLQVGAFLASLAMTGGLLTNLMAFQDGGIQRLAPPPVAASYDDAGQPDAAGPPPQPDRVLVLNAAESLGATKSLQAGLAAKGYYPGPADGVAGLMTRAALMAFEYDHGLPLMADVTPERVEMVTYGVPADAKVALQLQVGQIGPEAVGVIRTVQQSLEAVGYAIGAVDGTLSPQTRQSIRDFEIDQGLPETGRVSGRLMARLVRLADQGKLALR